MPLTNEGGEIFAMPLEYPDLSDYQIENARHQHAAPVEGAEFDLSRQEVPDPNLWNEELQARRDQARRDVESLALSSVTEAHVAVPGVEAGIPSPEMMHYAIGAEAKTLADIRARAIAVGKVGDTTVLGYYHPEQTAYENPQDRYGMAA